MKFAFALIVFALSLQANARTFNCTSDSPLWSTIDNVKFAYDSSAKTMSMKFNDGNDDVTVTGKIDANFKSRAGSMVRFTKLDGDIDFSELTAESYLCEILASQSLVAPNSNGGTLTLRCRGESFENSKYV